MTPDVSSPSLRHSFVACATYNIVAFLLLGLAGPFAAEAQTLPFSTYAGYAGAGSADGTGSGARFWLPGGVALDGNGNIYVADTANNTVRKISPGGASVTFAGLAGASGSSDGQGSSARFSQPSGIAVDGAGNIYVADSGNHTIRKVDTNANVSTLAGFAGVSGSSDGLGTNAFFNQPQGLALDSATNLYVADYGNHTIRKVSPSGNVITFAGYAGNFGSTNGSGTNAQFYQPQGVAVDFLGNIYVADSGNDEIRKISAGGSVTTLAGLADVPGSEDGLGTNAQFWQPEGVAVDGLGNVYVADTLNNTLRMVSALGNVTTIAGLAGATGSTDGTNAQARFWGPQALAATGTTSVTLYVADTQNGTLRQVSISGAKWTVSTFAGSPSSGSTDGPVGNARFNSPQGLAADSSGDIYVADSSSSTIRKVNLGTVSTYAGQAGNAGYFDANGTNALFNGAQGLAVDTSGNIYVADTGNDLIRKISSAGSVSTLAGQGGTNGNADGTGTSALFYLPQGVGLDSSANLYVADTANNTIRQVSSAGVVRTLAGVAGSPGTADGTNTSALFNWPVGLALDQSGNVYVSDCLNHTIRQISPVGANWVTTTLAGQAGVWGNSDGTNGSARFFLPRGLVVDSSGNVWVSDAGNQTIRKLTPVGTNWVVTTVAGMAGLSGVSDGFGSGALFNYPAGLTTDASGRLYVADSANDTLRWDVLATPSLQVSSSVGQVLVLWPLNSDGFVLETSSVLGQGAYWAAVTATPGISGTNYVLSTTPVGAAFYRLHKRNGAP